MNWVGRDLRRALAPLLAVLLLGGGTVVPLLDSELFSRTLVLETEHHPSSCPTGHDHTLCTQVGANQWASPDRPRVPTPWTDLRSDPVPRAAVPGARSIPGLPFSRAPPLA